MKRGSINTDDDVDRQKLIKIKTEPIDSPIRHQSNNRRMTRSQRNSSPKLYVGPLNELREKRTFCCHLCGKTFKHFCRLKVHMPSHTRECHYQCWCLKAYKNLSSLNVHKRKVHTRKYEVRSIRQRKPAVKDAAKMLVLAEHNYVASKPIEDRSSETSPIIKLKPDLDNFLEIKCEPNLDDDDFGVLSEMDPLELDYTPFTWNDSDSEVVNIIATAANRISAIKNNNNSDCHHDKENRKSDEIQPKLELWQKDSNNRIALYVDILRAPKLKHTHFSILASLVLSNGPHSLQSPSYSKYTENAVQFRVSGDFSFNQQNWCEAVEWYNRSLCYAEQKTFYFSTAYAKRAQCYFNMRMYRTALIDLSLAEKSGIPVPLIPELERHKNAARARIASQTDGRVIVEPKLSAPSNGAFPEMANTIEIAYNEWCGRHIVARQAIDIGQIVLIESGFVSTTTDFYEKCCVCLASDTNLVPCSKCTRAMVCKRCVSGRIHQIECELQLILGQNATPCLCNVIRSFLNAIVLFASVDQMMQFVEMAISSGDQPPEAIIDQKSKYRAFLQLIPKSAFANVNVTAFKSELTSAASQLMAAILCHKTLGPTFAAMKHRRFLSHLLMHHICVIQKFSTTIGVADQKGYIETTAPISTYFKHSCAPNVAKFLVGSSVIVVAMRPIQTGEQLLACYCDVRSGFVDRQQFLHAKFRFQCMCERCEPPIEQQTNLEANRGAFDPVEDFVQRNLVYLDSEDQMKRRALTEMVVGVLQRFGRMPWNYRIEWAYMVFSLILSHRFQKKLNY